MSWRRVLRKTADYLERVQDPFVRPEERLLFSFAQQSDLDLWSVFQDRDAGGKSTAELTASQEQSGTAVLSGIFSTELDMDLVAKLSSKIQRSGFVGINSKEGAGYFDGLDEYDGLVFKLHGDGRHYIANVRTDNWIIGGPSHDVWQAPIFARKGGWQEVTIPFNQFLLSWKGKVVEDHQEMNPDRILSIGLAIAGGKVNKPGRFSLGLDWIKATNLGT